MPSNSRTSSFITYGTYEKGNVEDGVAAYNLNAAAEVLMNSYSLAGGYKLSINTMNATYPVEMLAKSEGEKNMANSKADVLAEYGAGYVIYATEAKNTFSFVKDGGTGKEEVKKASGSINGILAKNLASVNLTNVYTSPGAYGAGSWTAKVIQLHLTEDNKYEHIQTELIYGYNMLLGTTTIVNYGKAEKGAAEDGYAKVTLADADRVVFNSFSLAGGYNISIDTLDCTYPVEMLAKGEGEKNMANKKEDVINEYGKATTYYVATDNNTLSLTNPNA